MRNIFDIQWLVLSLTIIINSAICAGDLPTDKADQKQLEVKKETLQAEVIKHTDRLLNGDYEPISKAFSEYRNTQTLTIDGENAYSVCVELLASNPRLEVALAKWCEIEPENSFALALYGAWSVEAAWNQRGGGWAQTVTPDGWKGYEEYLQQAENLLTTAYELEPKDYVACRYMITVKMGRSDLAGQEQWFDRAVSTNPIFLLAYASRAWGLYPRWCGSEELALNFINDARKKHPIFSWLKIYWFKRETPAELKIKGSEEAVEAQSIYQYLKTELPNSSMVLCNESMLLVGQGAIEEALKLSSRALKLDGSAENNYQHAYNLWKKGKVGKITLSLAQRAIELNPHHSNYWRLLADCYKKTEQYNKAIESVNRAIELDFSGYYLHWLRADLHLQVKNYSKALEDAKNCVRFNPNYAWGHFAMGRAYGHLGQHEDADLAFEKTLETQLNPNHFNAAIDYYKEKARGK